MPASIWAAVSGLDNHQTWMDSIGNNIANTNTSGFKAGRFEFEDILAQSLRGASPPAQAGVGGTNPQQVGLGTTTGSIDTILAQGSLQQTNVPTDVAIVGSGYFVLSDGTNNHYTRDSVFHVDAAGNVVASDNGLHLMGYGPNTTAGATPGSLDTTRLVPLTIPQTVATANNTTFLDMFGNLNSGATSAVSQVINVFDSLGQSHPVTVTFTPGGSGGTGGWTVTATSPDLASGQTVTVGNGSLTFGSNGQLPAGQAAVTLTFGTAPWVLPGTTTASNATQAVVSLQLSDPAVGSLTSFATPTSISTQQAPAPPAGQGAGNPAGFLKSFTIKPNGTVLGEYTSSFTQTIGQVVLATFTNPAGLQRIGQNDWDVSSDSGQANINVPGSGPSGTVAQGNIETSNVNLANELTGMILAERGFQANSKMVTTSDEMLQDVVGMKR